MKVQVFDGETFFDDYYFENDEIISQGKYKPCCYFDDKTKMVILYKNGERFVRSLNKLKKWSVPNAKLKQLLKRVEKEFVPVFGYENLYKFNPNNPFEVYSVRKRALMSIIKTRKYYQVGIKSGNSNNLYIHKMVAEYFHKKFINTKKYQIHHLSHNPAECNIENLLVLPSTIHRKFEASYKKMNKGLMSKEDVIKKINKFNIPVEDKEKLIKSLDNAKT